MEMDDLVIPLFQETPHIARQYMSVDTGAPVVPPPGIAILGARLELLQHRASPSAAGAVLAGSIRATVEAKEVDTRPITT